MMIVKKMMNTLVYYDKIQKHVKEEETP
jgi:hypothetical protein